MLDCASKVEEGQAMLIGAQSQQEPATGQELKTGPTQHLVQDVPSTSKERIVTSACTDASCCAQEEYKNIHEVLSVSLRWRWHQSQFDSKAMHDVLSNV